MGAVTGLGVFCDESSMKDPEKFVEIYEEKFFEIVKSGTDREGVPKAGKCQPQQEVLVDEQKQGQSKMV